MRLRRSTGSTPACVAVWTRRPSTRRGTRSRSKTETYRDGARPGRGAVWYMQESLPAALCACDSRDTCCSEQEDGPTVDHRDDLRVGGSPHRVSRVIHTEC